MNDESDESGRNEDTEGDPPQRRCTRKRPKRKPTRQMGPHSGGTEVDGEMMTGARPAGKDALEAESLGASRG